MLTKFKELDFKRHPLAPRVVCLYGKGAFVGCLAIETDDLLGCGVGDKFHYAAEQFKRHFNFGT